MRENVCNSGHILCPQSIENADRELFRYCCEADLEGIAKWKFGAYVTAINSRKIAHCDGMFETPIHCAG